MSLAERWIHRPQNVWARKALFQIHLWMGIGLGLYVLLISLSGSIIVFRNELYTKLWHGAPTVAISEPRLDTDQLRADIRQKYPEWALEYMWPSRKPDRATEVWLTREGTRKTREFDPYTGKDLGSSVPWTIAFLAQVIEFHTNLLAGNTGRVLNAAGGFAVIAIALTGAIVWWPGVQSWRRSLTIRKGTHWKRLMWDLHSAAGIWTLALVALWGVTGIYVAFPTQFKAAVDAVIQPHHGLRGYGAQATAGSGTDSNSVDDENGPFVPRKRTREDKVLRWFYYLHFGNFAGWRVKAIWVVLGLTPSFLFVTGFVMWWNRVASKALGRRWVVGARIGAVETVASGPLAKS